ncbi:hypothetical protein F383_35724 [Gossypium arboreum]|uniref:Uncharacterized protein n=1 Tax=Gossypium arboreum TaxID=29729 RepID=A0A0B0NBU5_GOSAR|nr:hypothetical protein F383_35724 [Gossypium arboreum]
MAVSTLNQVRITHGLSTFTWACYTAVLCRAQV